MKLKTKLFSLSSICFILLVIFTSICNSCKDDSYAAFMTGLGAIVFGISFLISGTVAVLLWLGADMADIFS